ncbi:hypothetical protein COOONC_18757 [Cooperia oncophora]
MLSAGLVEEKRMWGVMGFPISPLPGQIKTEYMRHSKENLQRRTFKASPFQSFMNWHDLGILPISRFILSYVPGGERGLRFMSSICTGFIRKSPTTVLPI